VLGAMGVEVDAATPPCPTGWKVSGSPAARTWRPRAKRRYPLPSRRPVLGDVLNRDIGGAGEHPGGERHLEPAIVRDDRPAALSSVAVTGLPTIVPLAAGVYVGVNDEPPSSTPRSDGKQARPKSRTMGHVGRSVVLADPLQHLHCA